jgi:hypothetical protein
MIITMEKKRTTWTIAIVLLFIVTAGIVTGVCDKSLINCVGDSCVAFIASEELNCKLPWYVLGTILLTYLLFRLFKKYRK